MKPNIKLNRKPLNYQIVLILFKLRYTIQIDKHGFEWPLIRLEIKIIIWEIVRIALGYFRF